MRSFANATPLKVFLAILCFESFGVLATIVEAIAKAQLYDAVIFDVFGRIVKCITSGGYGLAVRVKYILA